ncbi:excinuclease ABC subunit UvrA [Micromonospora sp. CPCC 206060]|uniref:excinuclease ABC subunit UvrA n=1 Tax=Micromonospora sp. CPCC 206060 TaxID=3122406 RepID=UPI002FEE6FF2
MGEKIEIRGARQHNLRNISLDVPKRKITVFTGVSGSGKSSLVFGTIAAESRRLVNETYTAFIQGLMPHYAQPDVDELRNLSAAIVVDQKRLGGNSRSTVGTVTDTYAMLRLLYSRAGEPRVGPAHFFSFNDPEGMCGDCDGLGWATRVALDELLDRDRSLNEGAIRFPAFEVDSWYWNLYAQSGLFDNDRKLRDYTDEEWHHLINGPARKLKVKLPTVGGTMNSTYEGLLPRFKRLYLSKEIDQVPAQLRADVARIATSGPCTSCAGTRLNEAARTCRVQGRTITECTAMQVSDLAPVVHGITDRSVAPLVTALAARLESLVHIGLGYLSLDRESATLSGGEAQRVRMVRHLGSSLTDIAYVLDEPSVGLHPHDVHRLNDLLIALRDKGNTILVVEHEPEVIAIADHVVDMGPGAGEQGGEIVYTGDLAGLRSSGTLTGRHLDRRQPLRTQVRPATGWLHIDHADLHNLRDVSVRIPTGVLTVVTGVAGSGKSALIRGCLPRHHPESIIVDQTLPRGSKRSNPATYTGLLDLIRRSFASANGVSAALFSANSEGACPKCQGLGMIYTDLAFLETVATVCEACGGQRYRDEVLRYRLRGRTISEVLAMSVTEARTFFTEPALAARLAALDDVGLGYLTLGQPLDTLSGGERQRIKLASELGRTSQVYVLDEPTTGLHPHDVAKLIVLLDRLVDGGSTVVTIEHNLDVVGRADWIIDLGPGAGHDGGTVVFEGTPADLVTHSDSLTGRHLAAYHRTDRPSTGEHGRRADAVEDFR